VSHLRFGPRQLRAPYLIDEAQFVACHQFELLERYDVLESAREGAVFLINAPYPVEELWDKLPEEVQRTISSKRLSCHAIDAHRIAREHGLRGRINTVMQACFFALSGVLPIDDAIASIEKSIQKVYGGRGEETVRKNISALRAAIENMKPLVVPGSTHGQEAPTRCRRRCTRFRPACDGHDPRRQGRSAAGQRLPGRRNLAGQHLALGEAQLGSRDPGLGREALHPVQQMCAGVPACGDPRQGLPGDPLERAPATFKAMGWKGTADVGSHYSVQVAQKTARAAAFASRSAPPRTRPIPRIGR